MAFTIHNPARARLEAGELAIGIGVRMLHTAEVAPLMKNCGYDFLFIDFEHTSLALDCGAEICVAAHGVGITPLARVPAGQYWMASRILDSGAQGIIMPHVRNAADARDVVDNLMVAPRGHRSPAGMSVFSGFMPVGAKELGEQLNATNLIVVMIEGPEGVENAEAIAAVPGVDVLMIGTADLTRELGVAGNREDKRVEEAYRTVIAACTKHGKWAAMAGISQEELIRKYLGMGIRMVHAGQGAAMMPPIFSKRAQMIRGASK